MKRLIIFAASLICSLMLNAQTKEAAVLFSGGDLDDSYLLAEKVSVVFDEDGNGAIYAGEAKVRDLDIINTVKVEFKDAFKLNANQDPVNTENYYSTFYTSEGAYRVPETAKAYIGEVEGDVLKLTDIGGIIHKGKAVILRATGNGTDSSISLTLMPSANTETASKKNVLKSIDEEKTLGANDYALSYGKRHGVGFYPWDGKKIGANKAYLTLSSDVKALAFEFEDGEANAIQEASPKSSSEGKDLMFNLNGVRVGSDYKGVVIKNGRKMLRK